MLWLWILKHLILRDLYPSNILLFFVIVFMDSMLFWNCRGVGNSRFPGLIRDYIRLYKLCFLTILEPRISGPKADTVVDRIGFDGSVCVEAEGFARGIWCLWKRHKIAINVPSTSKYSILLKVNPRSLNPWLLSVVYGSLQERHKEDL